MCGIAGIYRPEGHVEQHELEAMAKTLYHRGPDAWSLWRDRDVGFAHTRLRIVDLSERAAQPMRDITGNFCITYNGEIYNHHELRERLLARGVSLRSSSDTEVLLEMLASDGVGCLSQLEGMFAFAFFDRKTRILTLVRDRAGEKPLFYMPLARGGVAFASEIKALKAVEALQITADWEQIAPYLVYGYVPSPNTFYRGIRQLEPGHWIQFSPDSSPRSRRYWAPSFQPQNHLPLEDAKRELRARMKKIVQDRLAADVPVGAFLSGGLDSATVVGIATRDLGRTVHTYSIGFEDRIMDESGDARISARHLGSVHQEFIVGEKDLPSIEMLVEHHDGPFADSSAIPTYLVSKMARSHVTVAITGDGGDEVFGGYLRFIGGQLGEFVPQQVGQIGQYIAETLQQRGIRVANSRSWLARMQRFGRSMARPLEHKLLYWNSVFPPDTVVGMMLPEHRRSMQELVASSDQVFSETIGQSALARILHHNFRTYLPEDLLVKVDRCTMATSLEARSPFLDSGLIDFVGTLPDSYKIQGMTTKRLLRETFQDLFAPELLKRPKRGFGVPLWRWMEGSLAPLLRDTIYAEDARIYRFLNRDILQRDWGNSTRLDAAQAGRLWTLLTLEIWLRQMNA